MADEPQFESAAELFEALRNPNALERKPVLAWVANHPAESIALGEVDGRDVVDVLVGLIERDQLYGYWQDLAITIGVFDGPKVTEFFMQMLAGAKEAVEAQDAANALARRDRAGLRDRLVDVALSDEHPDRAAAAAQLLVQEELPERAAVRVAALEEDRSPPPLSASAADAWAEVLAGPFAAGARDRLAELGGPAAGLLAERWDRLAGEDRAWLLEWATDAAPTEAERLVARALEEGPDGLARAALECAARLPEGAVDAGLLGRWGQHEDPAVRAAAIAAGAAADPDHLVTDQDADPEVVVAAIRRLGGEGGAGAAEKLAPQLASDSPEVRAAAREEIVGLGPEAIDSLRPLVRSESPEARAGAVRALLDLGDDEWLERELL